MNNLDRAKAEFERIMAEVEGQDSEARDLQGIERLEQLFAEAKRLGMDEKAAWKMVQGDPKGLKAGVITLFKEVYQRKARRAPPNVP